MDWLTKLTNAPSDRECRETLGETGYWIAASIGAGLGIGIVIGGSMVVVMGLRFLVVIFLRIVCMEYYVNIPAAPVP